MSPKEGIFMAGVIGGLILCSISAQALGVNRLLGLVAGVIVGLGLGYVAQKLYVNMTNPPQQR